MEDDLIEILSGFGFPVFRQGSLTDTDAYPDSFFTFWKRSMALKRSIRKDMMH